MGVLALVLLFNQTLGLLHGIAHGPSIAAGTAAHVAQVPNVAASVAEFDRHAAGFLTQLFSGHSSHDGDPECRLYDQSSHFDAMPGVPVVALPLGSAAFRFLCSSGPGCGPLARAVPGARPSVGSLNPPFSK